MKKITNFTREEKYTCDAVINRGYAIYDDWLKNKLSSRKIVESVENAVCAIAKNKTKMASVEALSYLFALDMRIRERYKSILHCIFRYFSWRREIGALKRLKDILNIPVGGDIRDAIEVALQAIRESIDAEDIEDSDDEIHGGKKNGRAEQKKSVSENKQQEATTEETVEENSKIEELENSEEKSDEIDQSFKDERVEEQAVEPVNEQPVTNEPQAQNEALVTAKENQIEQSENYINIEINSSVDNNSKPLENTNNNNYYIDSVDPFIFGGDEPSEKSEKSSYLGDIFMENAGSERELDDENSFDDIRSQDENSVHQSDASKEKTANEYSSDELLQNQNSEFNKDGAKIESENALSDVKQGEEALKAANQANVKNDMRVPIQVDITNDVENEYRKEMHSCLTDEMLYAMANRQAEAAREQISVAMAEFGSDQPFEMIGFDNLDEVKETTNVIDKK